MMACAVWVAHLIVLFSLHLNLTPWLAYLFVVLSSQSKRTVVLGIDEAGQEGLRRMSWQGIHRDLSMLANLEHTSDAKEEMQWRELTPPLRLLGASCNMQSKEKTYIMRLPCSTEQHGLLESWRRQQFKSFLPRGGCVYLAFYLLQTVLLAEFKRQWSRWTKWRLAHASAVPPEHRS